MSEQPTEPRFTPPRRRHLRVGAAIAAALVVALIVWLLVRDNGDSNPSAPKAEAASVEDLAKLPQSVGHAVYWAGPSPGFTYELSQASGRTYIRYLPPGVDVGDGRPNFLSVGTYRVKNAYETLSKLAKKNSLSGKLPKGGIAVISDQTPGSVYLAYRGTDLQIEVYDPSPARARRLVFSGRVRPIG